MMHGMGPLPGKVRHKQACVQNESDDVVDDGK